MLLLTAVVMLSSEAQRIGSGAIVLALGAIAILLPFMWAVMSDLINQKTHSD